MMEFGIAVKQQLRADVRGDPEQLVIDHRGVAEGEEIEPVRRTFEIRRLDRNQLDGPSAEIVVRLKVANGVEV